MSGGTPIGEVVLWSRIFAYAKANRQMGIVLYLMLMMIRERNFLVNPSLRVRREYQLMAINKVPELVKRLEQKAEELLKGIE